VKYGNTLQDIRHDGQKPPRAAEIIAPGSICESTTA
jgi:hypothetical protein